MSKKGLNGKVTFTAKQDINIHSKDVAELTNQLKEFNKVAPNISSIVNSVDKYTSNTKADKFSEITKSVKTFVNTVSKVPDLDVKAVSDAMKVFEENVTQVASGLTTLSEATTSRGLRIVNRGVESTEKLFKTVDEISKADTRKFNKGIERTGKMFDVITDKLSDLGTRVAGMEKTFKSTVELTKEYSEMLKSINSVDGRRMKSNINKLNDYYQAHAEGVILVMNKEYERFKQIRGEKEDHNLKWNIEQRRNSKLADIQWFTELKDKGLKYALFGEKGEDGKTKGGTLGLDIKGKLLGGIKGALLGALTGAITGAIQIAVKIFLAPLQIMKKLVGGVFGLLKKGLSSAQTFTKLLDLVVLPFTLLFTLLFAPILMKLAPLLVDVVNTVMSKWDALEGMGDKIAEVLSYFFDPENWFSFGNMIEEFIFLLNDLADVAILTFELGKKAGREGLDLLTDVATNVIMALSQHIQDFLYSSAGMNLFFNIGRMVGVLLVEGLKVAAALLIDLIIALGGTITGVVQAVIGALVSLAVKLAKIVIADTLNTLTLGIFGYNSDKEVKKLQMSDYLDGSDIKSSLLLARGTITNYDTTTISNTYYNNVSGMFSSYGTKELPSPGV